MTYRRWVIDASMGFPKEGLFCFCPMDEAENIITGLNLLAASPPACVAELFAVVHPDGQGAVEEFMEKYGPIIREMKQVLYRDAVEARLMETGVAE